MINVLSTKEVVESGLRVFVETRLGRYSLRETVASVFHQKDVGLEVLEKTLGVGQPVTDVAGIAVEEKDRLALMRLRLEDEVGMQLGGIQALEINILKGHAESVGSRYKQPGIGWDFWVVQHFITSMINNTCKDIKGYIIALIKGLVF